jgi:N-hydroxyarylamine O-acetyltransferase
MTVRDAFDLDAYLRRIGHDGPREPTLGVLEAVHLAHAVTIPFENLDIRLGRPIRLDLASLQAKLVNGRRGGYCFEQNTLFAAALETMSFQVTRLAARVRFGATRLLPRTHMLLRVDIGGEAYLADVGFGGDGLLGPVPLTPGQPVRQGLWTYRVVEEAGLLVLQSRRGDGWLDLYAFSLEPQHPVDFEVANHYTATHSDSIFVRSLTIQRPTPAARHVLRNRDYLVESAAGTNTRHVPDDEELCGILVETFGLDVPAELLTTALRNLGTPSAGADADRAADA